MKISLKIQSIIHLIFLVFLIFLRPVEKFSLFNNSYHWLLFIIYFIQIFIFLKIGSHSEKNWLRFDVLFLIGFTIVHIQIPLLSTFGIEPARPNYIWINKQVVNYASWLSITGITCWMFGFSFFRAQKGRRRETNESNAFLKNGNLPWLDFFLLIAFVGFLITVGRDIYAGVYDVSENWGDGASHLFLLYRILLYLRIIYFFAANRGAPVKKLVKELGNHKIFFAILVVHSMIFLLSGSRMPIIQSTLVVLGSYAILIKDIKFKTLAVFVVSAAIIFTLIRFGRSQNEEVLKNQNVFERGYKNYKDYRHKTNLTDELASSVRILYRSINSVPTRHPFLNGITYYSMIVSTFPIVGTKILEELNVPFVYQNTPVFFTWLGQGHNPTYGEGSEIIADIYVNFGNYGVYVLMFIFGCFIGFISSKKNENRLTWIILYIVLLNSAVYLNRAPLLMPLKDVVYILVLHYIFSKYFFSYKMRKL